MRNLKLYDLYLDFYDPTCIPVQHLAEISPSSSVNQNEKLRILYFVASLKILTHGIVPPQQ